MSKSFAEIKFEKNRKRLSEALQNLEKTIKLKLNETALRARFNSVDNSELDNMQNKIAEQRSVITALEDEINRLQNSLSELDKEADFNKEKNKILSQRFSDFYKKQSEFIDEIDLELSSLEHIIDRRNKNVG